MEELWQLMMANPDIILNVAINHIKSKTNF